MEDKQDILLESGTNEIEIMEFTIAGNIFGINVAKVKEIMMADAVKPMPLAHPAVEGVYKPRETVITVIDLPCYLNLPKTENIDKNIFIVTNFNKMSVAFRVHTVVGIDRISWKSIEKPDKTIYGGTDGVATGIAQFQGRLITILDFEKIVADIAPETSIQMGEIEAMGVRERNDKPILVVDDSVLLRKMIVDCLTAAGYTNLIKFENGQEAWDFLVTLKDEEKVRDIVSCVITDIEMPQMDGHRLTKMIKEDKNLQQIPVIIFSSLINNEMYIKGKNLGANEQLTKPEIGHLVDILDHMVME